VAVEVGSVPVMVTVAYDVEKTSVWMVTVLMVLIESSAVWASAKPRKARKRRNFWKNMVCERASERV
jgi:hypothetical protein